MNQKTKIAAFLCLFFSMIGWNAVTAQELLTNETIISMAIAKVDKSLIISKIRSEKGKYDLSTVGCINLKQSKVADIIISEMISATKSLPMLVNEDIITMYQGNVSKEIIIKKIHLHL